MYDIEATAARMLPCDPVANNKASDKSDRYNASELKASSIVGGVTRQNLDLRFNDQKEFHTLIFQDKKTLRD